ncbi:MAG: rRNA maturation RNase YbeY [Sandaracinaceae bacterium]|nr:rRNA maturation RNase YbeY [Sandaracinaceae bacterium]
MPVHSMGQGLSREERPWVRRLRVWAEWMIAALGMENAELSLLVCDDETIRQLNAKHRGKNAPTDVLAFALRDVHHPNLPAQAIPEGVLGDVVISIPKARRQAQRAGHSLEEELSILLAHGILHLLGFDHRDPDEDRRMRARTDALRSTLRSKACIVAHKRKKKLKHSDALPQTDLHNNDS